MLRRTIYILTITLLLAGCSAEKQVARLTAEAKAAEESGNEKAALAGYEKVIFKYESENRQAECPVYDEAGMIALKLGETDKGISFLEQAHYGGFAGEQEYLAMAEAYKKMDNLSKEITSLERYLEGYPYGSHATKVRERLFETYVESENWELAYELWPTLKTSGANDLEMLKAYFKVTLALDKAEESDEVAYRLQDLDPDDMQVLEYFAKKYYWMAENRYQEEMAAYEANKTNSQYNHLVKALDIVTRHFKLSLNYFDKLFVMKPSPEYARFLANIYARLDNESQAEYFRKMIKE